MDVTRFIAILSTKGGTGKSLLARYLADRYEREGVPVTLIDADRTVGQLRQFCPQAHTVPPGDLGAIISLIEAAKTTVVLMDMPANGLDELAHLDREASLFMWLAENKVSVTAFNVMTPYRASTSSVGAMLDVVGKAEGVTSVALMNQAFGTGSDWVLWYGDNLLDVPPSRSRERLLKSGGIELSIPAIRPAVLVLLDVESKTFAQALVSETPLRTHYKQYLKTWLRGMDRAIRPIQNVLGL